MELRHAALDALALRDPLAKVQATRALAEQASASMVLDVQASITAVTPVPGRPDRPRLVDPRRVPQRSPATPEGRARLLHAVAHIELNAINLALDACWRFADLPTDYYRDWLRVAGEEAHHFTLVDAHLRTLGHAYGDFDAHDGLWQMAEATTHDVLARMALVPRILEARGLDVTPAMQAKLAAAGDARAVAILDVILRDEIGHVAIGNRWFHALCEARALDPVTTMRALMRTHKAPRVKPPLNDAARLRAGFRRDELDALLAPDAPA